MQLRTLSLLAALAAAVLPPAAGADTMDYSYAEIGFVHTELDSNFSDAEGDGLGLRGSLAINDTFFVFAGYQDLALDFDIDATVLQVGAGARWPLKDKLDVVGRLGIFKSEYEIGRRDEDEDGFVIGARVRGEVVPRFELEGGFDYADLDDLGNNTSLVGEARYFFMDQLAGGVLVEVGDDASSIGVNVRWTF
jgi:hypothetical protein